MEILRGEFVTYFLPIQHAAAHWASRVVSVSIWLCKRWIHEASENVADQSCIFFKNKLCIYIYSEKKKLRKKIPKKKYYLHWKRTEIQLVVFLFHPKKTRTDPSSSPNAERRNSAKRTSVVTFFTRENPLHNGDLLVLYLDRNRNFIRTISGPRLNDDLLIFPYIYIYVWCWFMGMRSYWWYFRDPAPPGM